MVELKSICWNHQGNPNLGSINFHSGSFRKPDSMVFVPEAGIIRGEAVFISNVCNSCFANVVLSCEEGRSYDGKLSFFIDNLLINEQNIHIQGGTDATVNIPVALPPVRFYVETVVIKCALEFNGLPVGMHLLTVYFLLNTPIQPWNVAIEFYTKAHHDYVFTDLLAYLSQYPVDISLPVPTAGKNIIELLNGSGMYYDVLQGAPYYTDANNRCKLLKFFTDLRSTIKGRLNCVDCATLSSVFAAALGIELPMARIGNNFRCNPIRAIGWTDWEEPFSGGLFSFHQVNVPPVNQLTTESQVYDACLHINAGENPHLTDDTIPYLPVGIDFTYANAGPAVHIVTPFHDNVYRERLAANGESCGFLFNVPTFVPGFTDTMGVSASNMKTTETVQKVIEYYHLADDDFVHSTENLSGYQLENVENSETLDEADNFTEKRLIIHGKKYVIRHIWETEDDILFLLAAYVSSIAAPIQAVTVDYPGERCFIINGCGYIFTRRGNLYHVFSEDGFDALDISRLVDANTF